MATGEFLFGEPQFASFGFVHFTSHLVKAMQFKRHFKIRRSHGISTILNFNTPGGKIDQLCSTE